MAPAHKLKYANTLSPQTLDFLKKANKQKDYAWLDRKREDYERLVRRPFVELAENIKSELKPLAPRYHFPSKGLARIKRPPFKVGPGDPLFKDWMSMLASKPSGSRFESNPHLFFGLFANEPDQVLVAAGLWQPSSAQTRRVREALLQNAEPFLELFQDADFKARFKKGFYAEDKLTKPPRGFPPDHQDIELIKLKKFVVMKAYKAKDLSKKNFHQLVIEDLRQGLRLNELLQLAIDGKWE